jgi:hypothetical protein
MYNLTKNNYHLKPKNSNIQTPQEVSEFIFELLKNKIENCGIIFDPCCGQGSLLKPWKKTYYLLGYDVRDTYGIDLEKSSETDLVTDFLTLTKPEFELNCFNDRKVKKQIILVLCNPPFNGMKPKLAPEVWLDKIIELFGKDIPIVLFAPIRLRLCSKKNSPRYQKWTKGTYPPISSIISLPTTGIFEKVDFFTEILIFNIKGLEPHYFYKPDHE